MNTRTGKEKQWRKNSVLFITLRDGTDVFKIPEVSLEVIFKGQQEIWK